MHKKEPLSDDEEKAELAAKLIESLRMNYKEINKPQWMGGLSMILAHAYKESSLSHEDFCDQIDKIKEFYKHLWEDNP